MSNVYLSFFISRCIKVPGKSTLIPKVILLRLMSSTSKFRINVYLLSEWNSNRRCCDGTLDLSLPADKVPSMRNIEVFP